MEIFLGKVIFVLVLVVFLCCLTQGSFNALAGDTQLQIRLASPAPVCGNDIREDSELCDGVDVGSQTCVSRGFSSGNLGCQASCASFNTANCVSGGGGGGGGGGTTPVPITSVVFSGRAYPKSAVTLLKDAQVAATTIAGPDANFSVRISSLAGGNYIFSLYTEDSQGIRSSLLSFPVSVTSGATTNISGIFIAPTISVDKSEVKRGDNIVIFGQSAPASEITISVASEETFVKTNADNGGVYLYNFDTAILETGQHLTHSKSALNGEISSTSQTISFLVGDKSTAKQPTFLKGDLNDDNKVNLIDFSIAAYWYKRTISTEFANKEKERLNGDGKIDLVDFSIMAYYWTG